MGVLTIMNSIIANAQLMFWLFEANITLLGFCDALEGVVVECEPKIFLTS